MNALSNLKCISNDNEVILNSSSKFSGNFNRTIIDFMNDEEKLLITFKKDTVGDTHIAASEGISLVNITATPNLRMEEQQQLTLKGYMSERVTVYDTFNETKVSTSCLISTESSTNNNSGSNDAISSVACEKYHNCKNIVCAPCSYEGNQGAKLILKMKLLKVYLHQSQCCITSIFSL